MATSSTQGKRRVQDAVHADENALAAGAQSQHRTAPPPKKQRARAPLSGGPNVVPGAAGDVGGAGESDDQPPQRKRVITLATLIAVLQREPMGARSSLLSRRRYMS